MPILLDIIWRMTPVNLSGNCGGWASCSCQGAGFGGAEGVFFAEAGSAELKKALNVRNRWRQVVVRV